MQAALFCLSIALSIVLPHAIVRWDSRRLPPRAAERVWNTASHWSAIVAFNWIAVAVHFWRTRRGVWGFILGVLVAGVGLGVQSALLFGLTWVLG